MRSDWCSTDTWKRHLRNRWDNEDQEKVNVLPCEAHHFNPEHFPKGLSLRYTDQSRAHGVFGWQGCMPQQELKQQTEEIYGDLTNTFQGQCWYSGIASYSQSRRGTHVAHTAFIYLFIHSILSVHIQKQYEINNMYQINTILGLNDRCRDTPLMHDQHYG